MFDTTPPISEQRRAPREKVHAAAGMARRQHGVITTHQLRSCGYSDAAIAHAVATGHLHRVHRAVYRVGHIAPSRESAWTAAVFAAGPGAALSHLCAAVHWHMWHRRSAATVNIVLPRSHRGVSGAIVHSSRSLAPCDTVHRNGIRVTTIARTLLDLGDQLTPYQLANVMHEAAFRQLLRFSSIDDVITRNRGRTAVTTLRDAQRLHQGGSAGTRSYAEDALLGVAFELGAETPLVNTHRQVADGTIETDFFWRSTNLCLELDGSGHARHRTSNEDESRDARLHAAGYEVVRVTPATMRSKLARLIATGRVPQRRRGSHQRARN